MYRKVFTGTINSGWTDISISTIDYDTIYINGNATHFVFTAGNTTYNKGGYYYDSTDWVTIQIQPTTKKISIGAGTKLSNINYTIVLEYTKTTD